MSKQTALPTSLYTSGGASHSTPQSTTGPEPIPFPNSSTQSNSQNMPSQQNRVQPSQQSSSTSSIYHGSVTGSSLPFNCWELCLLTALDCNSVWFNQVILLDYSVFISRKLPIRNMISTNI